MPVANDVRGKVFRHGSALFMARLVNAAGENLNQASVSSIEYTIYELTTDDPSGLAAVTGHTGVALTVGNVIYDTLQDDDSWTVDAEGYNFRHELDVSTNEAFADAGKVYQVRYELTPLTGQKIIFRFQLRCI
jgi:hypothetical protein